jgi:glucosylceramidase
VSTPHPRARHRQLILVAAAGLILSTAGASAAVARNSAANDVAIAQTSADLSQHLTRRPDLHFGASPVAGVPVIDVRDGVGFQRVRGFGAGMTDTSAWLIEREIPGATRDALMHHLFGPRGIHLNFLRVPMGASDFTKDGIPYTYDDLPLGQSDPRLAHFSIEHDKAYILPALRQALAINPQSEILASPWTPPAWMKGNQSLDNANNSGTLRPSAYVAWASYFVKFIRAYAREWVPITAITPQNEPTNPTAYPGLDFSARSEASWIVGDLRPALLKAGLHPEVYGDDFGWSPHGEAYAGAIASSRAASALTGISWHCYFGSPYVINTVRRLAPRLDQIVDECSPGITPIPTSEVVIATLRNWASTVALWNVALDPQGGPVQAPNTGCRSCAGLVTIDERTGAVSANLNYFQLGQASAFVQPGAQRIASGHFVSYVYRRPGVNFVTPGLDDVALRNPDRSVVLVAYNNSAAPVSFAVQWHRLWLRYTLPAAATVTFVWDRPHA